MIAIPLKTNKENSAVAKLFGKAKYFALINKNKIEIIKNQKEGGRAVVKWLKESFNVDTLITSHLGEKPFLSLLKNEINVYFAGEERILLNEVLLKHADGELPLITDINYSKFLEEESHSHDNNCSSKKNKNVENRLKKISNKILVNDFRV